jgi:hypothetical protein
MSREKLLKTLGFISTVIIPVLTLAVGSTLTYLKEGTDKTEKKGS